MVKNKIFVGTSGYNYKHWSAGVFYPPKLSQRKWLEYYAKYFNTVELNVTFYRLPKKETFKNWYKRTPQQFLFVVKGNRFITHIKKLKDCEQPLKLFFDYAKELKEKLGPILWQLPPNFKADEERLEKFCQGLTKSVAVKNVPQIFEFRHPSWFCQKTYSMLKKYKFSLCIAHSNRWPRPGGMVTAGPVYLRFHGGEILYGSNYSDKELKTWAVKAKRWFETGKSIYAYFNNDAYGFAVKNALAFRRLLETPVRQAGSDENV